MKRLSLASLFLFLGGCSLFGRPYDWNSPRPTREKRSSCRSACESDQTSDRSYAMCSFACESLRNPWYLESHP